MIKKFTAFALACLLLQMAYARPAAAKTRPEQDAQLAEKVKAGIARLGTGPDARIEVRLRDNTKLKGYVSEVNDGGFAVTDPKTGAATQVAYPQVKVAKGNNLSKTATGIIVIGAIVAIGVIVALTIGKS
jgi:hypothetical protein